ncbi:MAG TPA: carbon storage regulator [Pirellulaceae bacterium]|nr:carbon storage regulator [Pirellulaceae bacterium]
MADVGHGWRSPVAVDATDRSWEGSARMLILSRKCDEEILIGGEIRIVVTRISGNRVALGVAAPATTKVLRGEQVRREPTRPDGTEVATEPFAASVPLVAAERNVIDRRSERAIPSGES